MSKLDIHTKKIDLRLIASSLVLLVLSLFVSCRGEIISGEEADGVAYIRFQESRTRDSLSITYETEDYDNLYWFYTAEKEDGHGTEGETESETPYNTSGSEILPGLELESGTIGPFSQGIWTFQVFAYKCPAVTDKGNVTYPYDKDKEEKIYVSDPVTVSLFAGTTKSISVTVTGVDGAEGVLALEDLYFNSSETIASAEMILTRTGSNNADTADNEASTEVENVPELTLTGPGTGGTGYTVAFGSTDPFSLSSGNYTCVVKGYKKDESTASFTSKAVVFAIYPGLTTTLTGPLTAGD